MRIGPFKFILFRCYNLSLGQFSGGDRLLRWLLTRLLIDRTVGKDYYCQSAGFFTYDQIEDD